MSSSDFLHPSYDHKIMRHITSLTVLLALAVLQLPCLASPDTGLARNQDGTYVVVGSFSSLPAAQRQADLLTQRFNEPIRIALQGEGQAVFFRLIAGPYPPAQAIAKRSEFRTRGVPDAWFVYTPLVFHAAGKPVDTRKAALTTDTETETPIAAQPSAPARHAHVVLQEPEDEEVSAVSVRGYLKSYAIAQQGIDVEAIPPGLIDDRPIYQSQNSVRIIVEGEPGNEIIWQVHYELTPVLYSTETDNPLYGTTFTGSENSYRIADLEQTLGKESGKTVTYQNLDRFNLQLRMEPGDLTIGRQAIAFGSARVINPTDVFLPFNVQTLNQEYRIGIDAIRFQQALGELGEVDMGLVLGKDAKQENSAVYVQVVDNYGGVDVHGIAMRFADHNLAGMGIQTALGEMGYWFEIAQVWNGAEYLRLSTGLDYAFSENLYGMIEYHYNGAGSRSSDAYQELLGEFAYQKGGVFLLGQNYLIPALNWTVSPLLSLSLQSISNLDDSSSFISLSGEYSISDNLYSNFGLYYFYGDSLKFSASPAALEISSEYGINPDLFYLALRYYF